MAVPRTLGQFQKKGLSAGSAAAKAPGDESGRKPLEVSGDWGEIASRWLGAEEWMEREIRAQRWWMKATLARDQMWEVSEREEGYTRLILFNNLYNREENPYKLSSIGISVEGLGVLKRERCRENDEEGVWAASGKWKITKCR